MRNKQSHRLNLWLEKKLSFPGCTSKQLQGNITVFENHIFLSLASLMIGIALMLFASAATIFINYMIAFSSLYALSLLLQILFPRNYMLTHTFISSTMHLLTFYFIIRLGGIPTSGGLILSGITNVLATIPRQRTWLPTAMFILYSVIVVLLVILKPWLHIPDQVTPALNSIMWMILSIILTGSALAFVLRFIRQQRRLEEIEAKHLKEINEFKDRFFTNITHEFRTPLTIIDGMVSLIEAQPGKWSETGLQKIKSNSTILLQLVNQMLNLARTEAGAISVNFVRRDINKYLAYQVEQFSSEAIRKGIQLRFSSDREAFEMDFDPEKLMHITSNLVSNALKYTPAGGCVEVTTAVTGDGEMYSIRIRDTGTGIEKEHLDHLFDRFYSLEHQLSPVGTGIGLALTKELVQVLRGTISVDSVKEEGTVFIVNLPVTRNAPLSDIPGAGVLPSSPDDEKANLIFAGELFSPVQSGGEGISTGSIIPSNLPLLLLVEDSNDVVLYLQAILKYEYRIEVAENGKIGLERALEIIPDIVLSDVMMPVMDGIELLEKVKNDIRTSHIPVVMLTAKADIDSRLTGLERGADAYLAKPVDERELHIQLKNLVDLRKKLYERYSSLGNIPETTDIFLKKEDEFILKVRNILESNLGDDEFGINRLCDEMAVSRAQLYRKFKSLSNRTIGSYLKSLRLNKARELLLSTDMNVSEVTYIVGFKNLSHFSREFSHEFGIPPSEIRNQ
ncbi:MAG: helix-turn-helix domain-containing protein [Bacteroidales bacterium]|nr:helix-turn-helix domain-containing protein [Bacteroidales bacterium]OQB60582.1 MAG: Sensor histidine kinase TmoS [Bacteroidetes bacterium ADurb.Bin145]HOU02495.1 ATP-binding protein [Bacteroidales bacterium]HQK68679.1 ATP-binding protein [Bacteroidales bacterium]